MSPKFILTIILFVFFGFTAAISQNQTYKLKISKKEDKIEYLKSEIKNGVEIFKNLNKKPRLKKGDVVLVEMTDYNVFLFNTVIKSELQKDSTRSQNSNLFFEMTKIMLQGNTNLKSFSEKLQSLIKDNQENTRSQNNNTNLKYLQSLAIKYESLDTVLDTELANVLENGNILMKNKNAGKVDFESFCTKVKTVIKSTEKGLEDINFEVLKTLAYLDPEENDEALKQFLDDINLNSLPNSNFATSFINDKLKVLEKMVSKIESASFSTFKTITLDTEIENAEIKVELIPIEIGDEPVEQNTRAHFQIWYHDKYLNKKSGKLENIPCDSCTQLIKAQGNFIGIPPEDPSDIFNSGKNLQSGAYGRWQFFYESGGIKKDVYIENKTVEGQKIKTTAPEFTFNTSFQGKRSISVTSSIGLNTIYIKSGIKSYNSRLTNQSDSIIIKSEQLGKWIPVLSTNVKFESPYDRNLILGFSIGLGYGIGEDSDLHGLLGPTLRFGNLKQLSFSAGLAFSRVSKLRDGIFEGVQPITNILDAETIGLTRKVFIPGLYLGILMDL
ncbi:MAG TPA: hypothetical protein VK169_14490 [Saprospiraceae bacterium]|nr:hypothetical protein [Saprospiraceae bacterium]